MKYCVVANSMTSFRQFGALPTRIKSWLPWPNAYWSMNTLSLGALFHFLTSSKSEPEAIETAPLYPYNNGPSNQFPLVAPQPWGNGEFDDKFDITKYWGNLAPWYSVSSADYGLPDASPLVPDGCNIVQMQLLYRHGARYPTTGAAPSAFAQKLAVCISLISKSHLLEAGLGIFEYLKFCANL